MPIGLAAATRSASRRLVGCGSRRPGSTPAPARRASFVTRRPRGSATRASRTPTWSGSRAFVPLATHQRGRGTLYLGTNLRLDAEDLVELVEGSMSSPVYELLPSARTSSSPEHDTLAPRFVEDSVRLMVKGALDAYGELGDGDFVLARQLNFETIHNHDVLAERFGTVGELREELANGGHLHVHHTELRDWLRAV